MTTHIEDFLMKIQSVIGSKVVMNQNGQIEEIHIVSDLRRSPKQILRDVEAVLLSQFNQAIDYKKVSIAQIKGGVIRNEQDPRIKLKSIEYSNMGNTIDVTVTLEKGNEEYTKTKSGIKTTANVMRLSGKAVLDAIEQYLGIYDVFVFEDCKEIKLSDTLVIAVSITSIYHHREEMFIGTAKVGTDVNEAVTRATLDAINRHILQLENA
ncbi:hypothetical protein QBE53_00850 [Vallitaleaceae bacterium 9-2]